jgi:flagellar L-ring protein precursor FlgH
MRTKTLTAFLLLPAFFAAATPSASAQRVGSIYDPNRGPYGLIAEKTAFRKGDIVTVLISESQSIQNQESSDLAKSTNLNYKINLWDIKPNMFDPLPRIDADSSDSFIGSAKQEKSGAFSARLAAIVIDTLPNGNLVVSGRREIRVDRETKLIEFTGIVRRLDITAANTIESELVANAEIVYHGTGPLSDSTRRRGIGAIIHGAISWLWPF